MLENSTLRDKAYAKLHGNWKQPVLATLILGLISMATHSPHEFGNYYYSVEMIFAIFLVNPLTFGFYIALLKFYRDEDKNTIDRTFDVFKNYGKVLAITLLTSIYTLLWALLLIIPGIIKAYSYSMSFYIMNDNPELTADEAINQSMKMMDGYKMKLFLLDLSFILWYLAGIITLGIGLLWVIPYHYSARAAFYVELKERNSEIVQEL